MVLTTSPEQKVIEPHNASEGSQNLGQNDEHVEHPHAHAHFPRGNGPQTLPWHRACSKCFPTRCQCRRSWHSTNPPFLDSTRTWTQRITMARPTKCVQRRFNSLRDVQTDNNSAKAMLLKHTSPWHWTPRWPPDRMPSAARRNPQAADAGKAVVERRPQSALAWSGPHGKGATAEDADHVHSLTMTEGMRLMKSTIAVKQEPLSSSSSGCSCLQGGLQSW